MGWLLWPGMVAALASGGWYVFQPDFRQKDVDRLVQGLFVKEKRVALADVLGDVWELYVGAKPGVPMAAAQEATIVLGGLPDATPFRHGPVRLLKNRAYWTGYSEQLRNPVWTAYRVQDLERIPVPPRRPSHFDVDRRTLARVTTADYAHAEFDRGHMAPNYAIAIHFGEEAQRETFLMSNISPQRHALNAGPWKEFEQRVATSYPARFGEVWVVCGPLFTADPARLPAGVAIPDAFYLIVGDQVEGRLRVEAFILPQATEAGAALSRFRSSVDAIEARAGLDFFPDLPAEAQAALEARVTQRVW